MIKRILRATTILAGLFSTAAYADFTDLKFGQAQIADSQWNVNACMNTTTCQIYSKNPGTVYKIPFTTGQLTWAAGDYVKFSATDNATNPYNAIQYNSAGVQKVVMGTGHIINMGTDYFFFVGNDNNTGQLFSMTSGFANTSGLSWTGTLNPSLAQVNTLAAGGSTTPLAAGQAVTVTPTPTAPNITSASTNTNFATGTLGPWTAGGGTGTQTSTTYNANQGVGVSVVSGMTGFNTQGQGAGVPNSYSWTVTPPVGTYMASLQPTNGTVTSGANINTFDAMAASLGLSASSKTELAAAISASGGPATNAAWIKQDITLTNGQTFHMAWQYVSTDYVPFNDGSMTSLVNKSGSTVATINGTNKEFALLGFTSPGTGNYSTGSYGATGWQLANYTANADGTYTLGFAVFNQGDTANSPILFVTKEVGTTLNFTTSFGAIAPNAGSTAPNNATTPSAPTVVSTAPGTPIVTSSNSVGTPTITSVTNTNLVNSVDANGNPVVTTYFTVTSTTTTPNTVTTTTTPVTVTTYSDGTTSTANGTPVVTTSTTNSVTSNTTQPAIQNVATTKDVVTTNTTSGIATTASSTVNWATTSNSIITYTKNLVGKMLNINQNTTVITDHPSTTTTVVTTPITTVTTHTPTTTNKNAAGATTSVTTGTPVNTSNTIYQNVSSAVNNDTYTQTSNNVVRGVSATGFSDAVKMRNTNPFLVDTLSQKDGAWADPTASYYKTTGSMSKGGLSAGYQWTVENNSFGIAGTYVAGKSGGLTGATVDSTDYNVTGYILSKQEDFWVKGSIGAGLSTYNGTTSIPLFALYNNAKFKQNTYYADLTLYTADTYYGFRPLAGVTLNQSQINNVVELGSSLLSTTPSGKSTSVNPYVGIRYDLDNNISFETRVTQTKDFKTVGGIRAVAKTEIDKGIFLNATIGFDKGTGYTGALGTIGLKIEF
jgi:hypothetical protein